MTCAVFAEDLGLYIKSQGGHDKNFANFICDEYELRASDQTK